MVQVLAFFSKNRTLYNTCTVTWTVMYTGRRATVRAHRTRNPAITSPMLYRYTNFVRFSCMLL